MKEYHYENLVIGQSESFEYQVTSEKVDTFTLLTGDVNPLHINEEFAVKHGFVGRVVYGMLTASLFSKLGGCYLPGKYCLIQQVESKFLSPVYIGDTLTVTGTVKELYDSVQRADVKVIITNQYGKKVVKGVLSVGFLE